MLSSVQLQARFPYPFVSERNPNERLTRIHNWKSNQQTGPSKSGASRENLLSGLRKIRASLDPQDHITSRVVVNEFEQFIRTKRADSLQNESFNAAALRRRVQFSSHNQVKPPTPTADSAKIDRNMPYQRQPRPPTPIPQDLVNVIHTKKRHMGASLRTVSPVLEEAVAVEGRNVEVNQDPAYWKKRIRQGYLQTEELLAKLVGQRRNEEKMLGIASPMSRQSGFITNRYRPRTYASVAARVNHLERRQLDRSMERIRKQHETCFGKKSCIVSQVSSEQSSNSRVRSASAGRRSLKKHRATSRVSELHEPMLSKKATREPTTLPKSLASGIKDNWSFQKWENRPTTTNKINLASVNTKPQKNDVRVLFERHQLNQEGAPSPDNRATNTPINKRTDSKAKARSSNSTKEWVDRIASAKLKKKERDLERDRSVVKQQKKEVNKLYNELVMNKQRLSREDVDVKGLERIPSWRRKLGEIPPTKGRRGNNDDGEDKKKKFTKAPQWIERPPKGLSMWLEGVMAKAKAKTYGPREQLHDAYMRPLDSYHF